jgi:hypothetical protein
LNVLTGILFFSGHPDQYFYNDAGRLKALLVTGAKLVAVSTWSWPACRGHLDNRRAVPS